MLFGSYTMAEILIVLYTSSFHVKAYSFAVAAYIFICYLL